MGTGLLEMLFEDGETCGFGLQPVELGIGDGGEGFAEVPYLKEDAFALGWGGFTATESLGLAVGEDLGLECKAEEVVVGGQQVLGAGRAEAVVDGIDEIEGDVAGDKFEGLWGWVFRSWHRFV